MKLAIGSDHCGYAMKQQLIAYLKKQGHEIEDFGCYSTKMVDFPDIAQKVCAAILNGTAERGIMVCSTGIGAVIACNKIKGIRAGLLHDVYCAHQCVEHDNVQVMAIGGEVIGYYTAIEVINAFLKASFSENQEFVQRLKKLEKMEDTEGCADNAIAM